MLSVLDDRDWAEVFGEGGGGNCTAIKPQRPPHDSTTAISTFGREDVAEIRGLCEGENEGPDWIIWGRLKDGRWFFARGGCDYTGWDCRADNDGDVAATEADLIRFGMTDEDKAEGGE